MSWWVKEHIAVNDDETKQLCSIEADNQTSLPAADQSATAGFIIVRGSDAKDVSTGDEYIMNSSGTWIQQPSGMQLDLTGYATTQDLSDGLAEKATVSAFNLTLAGSPLVATEYSYSCIVTGDIVTICVRIVLGAELAINTSRNLFKIPSGYYPPVTCAGSGYADGKTRVFWVNTSGDVKIRIDEAIPAGAAINANFCYSYKAANWTTVTP